MRMFAKRARAPQIGQTVGQSGLTAGSPDLGTYGQTGLFFVQLRQYLGLSLDQVAARLETYRSVISALETGTVGDLPPWSQTHRIVTAYAALAGLDPAPALHCLILHVTPVPSVARPVKKRIGGLSFKWPSMSILPAWLLPRLPVWRIAAVATAFAILGIGAQTSVIEAAMGKLPAPIAKVIRHAQDTVLVSVSRKFEGLTWIDVDDPRSRRSDKLLRKPR